MSKKYYFIVDYNTKYGTVKKGESLTGRLSSASKTPKVVFDFYEITDPAKAEAGEGTFSINQTDLKNFASDNATTIEEGDKNKKVADNTTPDKGFKSWSTTKKTVVIGSGLAVLGLAVWYFVIRKK